MAANPLISKIVDAGIALAYSNKGAGIAGVWVEFLRQHIQITNDKCPTWMVDGRAVWVNEQWTSGLTPTEIQFLIAHETMHIALDHTNADMARAVGATTPELQKLLNIAQDAIINQALIDDGIGSMPTGKKAGVTLDQFIREGYTGPRDSVVLFEWLREECPEMGACSGADGEPGEGEALKGCSPSGVPGDEPPESEAKGKGEGQGEGEGEGDAPGQGTGAADDLKRKIRAERARATLKEASNKAGSGSAIAELMAPRPTRATVRQLIRQGFERASQTARNRSKPSYSRASRRSIDDSIVMPGRIGTEAWVAFAGDVSGSMSDEGRATLISFIESTAKEFPEVRVYLVTHTDRVEFADWMRAGGDLSKAKQASGFSGGTAFAPAYEKIANAGKKFDVLVHFTDGYNNGEWPECPARQLIVGLWGSGHGMTPPPAGTKVVPVESIEGVRAAA